MRCQHFSFSGMSGQRDIFSVMTLPTPEVSTETAEAVVLARWGIRAQARALRGERDRNFYLRADDRREFVLKFANPAEEADFRGVQTATLRRIARVDPDLPVPRVIPLHDGTVEASVPHPSGSVQCVIPGALMT